MTCQRYGGDVRVIAMAVLPDAVAYVQRRRRCMHACARRRWCVHVCKGVVYVVGHGKGAGLCIRLLSEFELSLSC